MISFALKNMATKKTQIVLVILSVVLSAGIAVLAYNVARQVNDGITDTAGYYSAIIGPSGSKTQLAMNTMYFTDAPLGTIPYDLVTTLKQDMRVSGVIPFAMADSFNGYAVVGTESAFLDGKKVDKGTLFDDLSTGQVVLGATVARTAGVGIGDAIFTSHSAGEAHTTPLTVVGILEETHTVYDKVVFTELGTIWEVHEHEEEGAHEEEHDHEDMHGMVCAILVKTKNPSYAMTLVNDYDGRICTDEDGDAFALQAIEPMQTVRDVLDDADDTKYIVFALCAVILLMNVLIILIITLLQMYHSAEEIALMRLIGISMKKINRLYLLENSLIGLCSVGLAFAFSRLCLSFMGGYVASMGVVLDVGKVYVLEGVIFLVVFLISVLPTLVCTAVMARRDGIGD